jgi:hypothetical protein
VLLQTPIRNGNYLSTHLSTLKGVLCKERKGPKCKNAPKQRNLSSSLFWPNECFSLSTKKSVWFNEVLRILIRGCINSSMVPYSVNEEENIHNDALLSSVPDIFPRLALDLTIGECPDRARHSVLVGNGVQVDILEGLGDGSAGLRVVAVGHDLLGVDVHVVAVGEVELESHGRGEVELRVQGAGAVAGHDGRGRGELVDVGGAGAGAVEALLDAVALVLDLGEGEVDFGDDASDVEAFGICVDEN